MPTTEKYLLGGQTVLLSTGLNSLANNSRAISGSYSNIQAGAGDGYVLCDMELVVTFSVAPAVNSGVAIWLLGCQDGSNFEDGDASTTPARAPDVLFPVRAVTTSQRLIRRVALPHGLLKALLINDATGQAFASSANTLTIRPVTRQGV